jgi:hypothetical protein
MSFEPRDYIRHILVEADYVLGRSKGLSFEKFIADETLQRAFVRSLARGREARFRLAGSPGAAIPSNLRYSSATRTKGIHGEAIEHSSAQPRRCTGRLTPPVNTAPLCSLSRNLPV